MHRLGYRVEAPRAGGIAENPQSPPGLGHERKAGTMSLTSQHEWEEDEVNLLDTWRAVKKRAWMILAITFVAVFTTGFLSYFVLTKMYEARASVLAPRESGGGGASLVAALAASGAGQFLGGLLPAGGGTNRDVFVAILKSRTMAQDLVDRFKLKDYYEAKFLEGAVKKLQTVTDIAVSKEGVISVQVEDKDPKLAAEIANAYITNLDRMFAKLGTTDAGRQRAFIAERLEKTEKTLRQAEDALRQFQEKNKAIVIQEQARGAMEESARVRGQIVAAEAQLELLRTFSTENNPQVVAQKRQLDELKRQLGQMQYGRGMELPEDVKDPTLPRQAIQIPFTKVPELGMELLRLTRDVKVQETVFSLLTAQFEQAKINEAKDTPTVQVLDRAVPPELKSRPKTVQNMAVAAFISLFVSTLLALFLERLERIKQAAKTSAA